MRRLAMGRKCSSAGHLRRYLARALQPPRRCGADKVKELRSSRVRPQRRERSFRSPGRSHGSWWQARLRLRLLPPNPRQAQWSPNPRFRGQKHALKPHRRVRLQAHRRAYIPCLMQRRSLQLLRLPHRSRRRLSPTSLPYRPLWRLRRRFRHRSRQKSRLPHLHIPCPLPCRRRRRGGSLCRKPDHARYIPHRLLLRPSSKRLRRWQHSRDPSSGDDLSLTGADQAADRAVDPAREGQDTALVRLRGLQERAGPCILHGHSQPEDHQGLEAVRALAPVQVVHVPRRERLEG